MTYLYSYSVSLHYKLYSISYSRNCNFKVTGINGHYQIRGYLVVECTGLLYHIITMDMLS